MTTVHNLDLFGNETKPTTYGHPGAYPATPGTGPEGKTCRDCQHKRTVDGGRRSYPKCALMREHWTVGPGTDIKAGSPACRMFVAKVLE